MGRALRTGAFLVVALALFAQKPRDPIEVLHYALPKLVETIERLPKHTCVQTVNRSYFRQNRARATCDETLDYKRSGYLPLELTATDRLRLDVAIGNSGREIYSWAGAGAFESKSIPELIGGGPLATGPFGPFLLGIFGNSSVHFFYDREETAEGRTRLGYRFRVPVELSRYELLIGEARRVIPYDGTFFLGRESSELERLSVHTTSLAAGLGVCDTTTTVDFARQTIGGASYLLPRESRLYAVGLGTETENVTSWSACREYRAESVIRFDDEASTTRPAGSGAADRDRGLPPGLPVTLVFETAIDSDVAAAGDPITARLRDPIVDPASKRILAPAGATAKGRIMRMEHHLVSPASFRIAILFETLEADGATRPFLADLDSKAGRLGEFTVSASELANAQSASAAALRPNTEYTAGRTLVFPSTKPRYILPQGYESRWVTASK